MAGVAGVEVEAELQCARMFLDVAFPQDATGRILRSSAEALQLEAGALFVLVRTRLANLWRLGLHLPPATLTALARLAGREARLDVAPADSPPPERLEPMRRLLAAEYEDARVERLLLYHGFADLDSGVARDAALESVPTPGSDVRWPARIEIPEGGSILALKWEERGQRKTLESRGLTPFADVAIFG